MGFYYLKGRAQSCGQDLMESFGVVFGYGAFEYALNDRGFLRPFAPSHPSPGTYGAVWPDSSAGERSLSRRRREGGEHSFGFKTSAPAYAHANRFYTIAGKPFVVVVCRAHSSPCPRASQVINF